MNTWDNIPPTSGFAKARLEQLVPHSVFVLAPRRNGRGSLAVGSMGGTTNKSPVLAFNSGVRKVI